jgi:uncharacterized protein YecT (DUF1311 family)
LRYLVLCCLFSCSLFAQDSPQYNACMEKAKAQPELNQCAGDEAARVDGELNAVYRKVLAASADDAAATAKIKAMQRAWVAYRDAYLEAMYPAKDKRAEYGSIYPMDAALLTAKLTRQQIAALNDLLNGGNSD